MSVAVEQGTSTPAWTAGAPRPARSRIAAYYTLTKPGITRLVVLTTAVGFYLAAPAGGLDFLLLLHTLIGTIFAASGTNALNQYVERDIDGLMRRTAGRPLPAGVLTPGAALGFSATTAAAGIVYLGALVNPTTALVVVATLVSYIFVYTPLKRRTTLATLVGAVPGALPIVAGWTAAGRGLEPGAWALFGILFLWQIPHFLALAWLYREDYRAGGFAMLSVDDDDGRRTGRQIFNYAAMLVPVSLLPSALGVTGHAYFFGALALGIAFLAAGVGAMTGRDERSARRLFLASVTYLPLLLLLMVADKAPT